MKHLVKISAISALLLLFSVDVFAKEERVCVAREVITIKDESPFYYGYRLKLAECNSGDVLRFSPKDIKNAKVAIPPLIASYCDYEKEITREPYAFSCVLKTKTPREVIDRDW